jgi:hypothetical protein
VEDAEEPVGEGLVDLVVAADEDAVGAEFIGVAEGHARVDAEFAGFVGAGRGHAALVGQAADNDRLARQRRVEEDLDGCEEGVDVDVDDEPGHSWTETLGWGFLPTVRREDPAVPAFLPRSIVPRIDPANGSLRRGVAGRG